MHVLWGMSAMHVRKSTHVQLYFWEVSALYWKKRKKRLFYLTSSHWLKFDTLLIYQINWNDRNWLVWTMCQIKLDVSKVYQIMYQRCITSWSDMGGLLTYKSYTGMCRPNGLFFHKKSLDMGQLFTGKTLRHGSIFYKMFKILGVCLYMWEKSLENGTFFWQKWSLEKGEGFEAWATHPHPNQIRVHLSPLGEVILYSLMVAVSVKSPLLFTVNVTIPSSSFT